MREHPLYRHKDVVAFGALHAFTSSVGQTFFISLFVPVFLTAFALERTTFSTLYSAVTITSALVLPYIGGMLDKVALRRYALVATLLLSTGCLFLALSPHVIVFIVALFMVRCLGQGVMTDINLTSTGRFFSASRGRAVGITTLGHPIGEGLLPLCVVALLPFGWRTTWFLVALLVLVASMLGLLILRSRETAPLRFVAEDDKSEDAANDSATQAPQRDWTRAEVLKSPGFYLMLPFWVLPAVLLTGFFFHQLALADEKGWSHSFIAQSFLFFAVFRALTSFLSGPFVDRFTARRLLVWTILPLVAGIGLLAFTDSEWAAPLYFALAGTMGVSSTTKGAFLPELFGTAHLGAIRALTVTAAVFATAICPPLFAVLLDAGFNFRQISLGSAIFGIATMIGCVIGVRLIERQRRAR